jgi:DNA-binding protein
LSEQTEQQGIVLVGKKPVMNYVVAALTFFNQGMTKVSLKARGTAISKAVDVAELIRRAFVKDLNVKNIIIGTETIERENVKSNVSIIEIVLEKPKQTEG